MKKALSDLFSIYAGQTGGTGEADNIGKDGDRGGGQEEQPFLPGWIHAEPGQGRTEGKHGGQGAQTGTGVDHLQCGLGQVKDIAFAKHRDTDHLDDPLGDGAGIELHRESNLIPNDGRQRHHEEEVGNWQQQFAGQGFAEKKESKAQEQGNERGPLEKKFRTDPGDIELHQPRQHQEQAPVDRFDGEALQLFPHHIDHVAADQGDEKPMGIVVVGFPVLHHGDQHRKVQTNQRGQNEQEGEAIAGGKPG